MTTSFPFAPPTTSTARGADGTPRTALGTRRVLVAEDHPGMLHLVARALRRHGHDVLLAHNGRELMQWVQLLTRWDDCVPLAELIVTDLRMPEYSGQDCLEHLRFVGNMTPVIVITAFGSEEVHRRALAKGACAVLDKPLQLDDLCELVRCHLP